MNKRVLAIGIIVLVVVVAVIGAALAMGGRDDDSKSSTATESGTSATQEDMSDMEGMDESGAATGGSSAASDDSANSKATTSVDIKDYAYSPASITVKVGDTVTWTNQDSVRHDVASDTDGSDVPNSELLAKGESYKFTFTKAGTYNIHCSPHPYMKQTVIVTE